MWAGEAQLHRRQDFGVRAVSKEPSQLSWSAESGRLRSLAVRPCTDDLNSGLHSLVLPDGEVGQCLPRGLVTTKASQAHDCGVQSALVDVLLLAFVSVSTRC